MHVPPPICGTRRQRHAAAAAELALIGPILVFILVAGTDFARLFYYYATITSCARNGALYGCLDTAHANDTSGIQAAAQSDASSLSSVPTVTPSTGADANGDPYVAVNVTYSFTTIISYPGIPNTVLLSRTVQMRVFQSTPN
jgi:Flp pilus assembly protein TadG